MFTLPTATFWTVNHSKIIYRHNLGTLLIAQAKEVCHSNSDLLCFLQNNLQIAQLFVQLLCVKQNQTAFAESNVVQDITEMESIAMNAVR